MASLCMTCRGLSKTVDLLSASGQMPARRGLSWLGRHGTCCGGTAAAAAAAGERGRAGRCGTELRYLSRAGTKAWTQLQPVRHGARCHVIQGSNAFCSQQPFWIWLRPVAGQISSQQGAQCSAMCCVCAACLLVVQCEARPRHHRPRGCPPSAPSPPSFLCARGFCLHAFSALSRARGAASAAARPPVRPVCLPRILGPCRFTFRLKGDRAQQAE